MPNIVVFATGSVASVRTGLIADGLHKQGHQIRLVHTDAAANFLTAERPLPDWLQTFDDSSEWRNWQKLGDPVLHIDLRKWASVFVVAPLDANTLGKLTNGLCDNLGTCIARAWPMGEKPFLVAPAMNTAMWNHPVTATQLQTLVRWGVEVIEPVEKTLACGDTGVGAMASHTHVVNRVCSSLQCASNSSNINRTKAGTFSS